MSLQPTRLAPALRWPLLLFALLVVGCTDGAGAPAYNGAVSLSYFDDGAPSITLGGYFDVRVDLREDIPGCTRLLEVGPCVQLECLSRAATDDAGTLSASADGTLLATAELAGFGYNSVVPGDIRAGQTITLSASGGAVPAFSGAVTAPPVPVAPIPTTSAAGTDLVLTWDPSLAADQIGVSLVTSSIAVGCSAPIAAGSLTVDATLTALLDADTRVVFVSSNTSLVSAGDYTVAVTAAATTGGTIAIE